MYLERCKREKVNRSLLVTLCALVVVIVGLAFWSGDMHGEAKGYKAGSEHVQDAAIVMNYGERDSDGKFWWYAVPPDCVSTNDLQEAVSKFMQEWLERLPSSDSSGEGASEPETPLKFL